MKIKGKLKNLKKITKDYIKIKKKLNSNFRKVSKDRPKLYFQVK